MDLQDQLRNFFPNHKISENPISEDNKTSNSHTQTSPLLCKYEKRKGKPNIGMLAGPYTDTLFLCDL